ncbi:MAG TPA: nucleotidyltransferase family protein [Steroidobacteraceae bacterium]|nr:nucleotidyltransferase family protein [Steroidobacteraceae bacterium]
MVLAAGRGERMRPLTDTTPKVLLAAGGKPLIVYHLEALARAGVREVIINLSWLGEQIRTALGTGERYGLSLSYSEEGPHALETGGGIYQALPLLGSAPFLVVNADNWTDFDFGALARMKLGAADDARIVLVPNSPHHPAGDFGLQGDRVINTETGRLTYAGIGIYQAAFFAGCAPGRFPLLPLLQRAIAAGRLRGQLHAGAWFDIGSAERLAALEARLRAKAMR